MLWVPLNGRFFLNLFCKLGIQYGYQKKVRKIYFRKISSSNQRSKSKSQIKFVIFLKIPIFELNSFVWSILANTNPNQLLPFFLESVKFNKE